MATKSFHATIALVMILCYLSPQILTASGCLESQNCAGCYNAKCTACKTGYYPSGNNCVNTTKITNCRTYNADGTCHYCDWPYYLSKKGECQAYCTNVTTWIRDTAGNRCMALGSSSWYKTDTVSYAGPAGTCGTGDLYCMLCRKSVPELRSDGSRVYGQITAVTSTISATGDGCDVVGQDLIVKNCMYYDSNSLCHQCIKGFALTPDGSACVDDSNGVSHCKQYLTLFGDKCAVCHNGYYASDEDTCSKSATTTATS